VPDRRERARDGAGGEYRAGAVQPGFGGVGLAQGAVGADAGQQEGEQLGRVCYPGGGLVAPLAQGESGVVVTLAPGGFGQSPQRWGQALK
jgi:hypothetical protein